MAIKTAMIQTPAARGTDPESSHLAAEKMARTGKRAKQIECVAEAVRLYPALTAAELAQMCGADYGMDRYAFSRRLADAATAGLVLKAEQRRCSVTCNTSLTWMPPQQEAA